MIPSSVVFIRLAGVFKVHLSSLSAICQYKFDLSGFGVDAGHWLHNGG